MALDDIVSSVVDRQVFTKELAYFPVSPFMAKIAFDIHGLKIPLVKADSKEADINAYLKFCKEHLLIPFLSVKIIKSCKKKVCKSETVFQLVKPKRINPLLYEASFSGLAAGLSVSRFIFCFKGEGSFSDFKLYYADGLQNKEYMVSSLMIELGRKRGRNLNVVSGKLVEDNTDLKFSVEYAPDKRYRHYEQVAKWVRNIKVCTS